MTAFVYMLTNRHHTVIYTGSTYLLSKRTQEHRDNRDTRAFTARYNCHKLVWYEVLPDLETALKREKQIKRYSRKLKEQMISEMNPEWLDLAETRDIGS
ncbi:unnamed protein product [Cyprideis torosa]|uniref:Uncharacterized protein n=1 Tax=Cyprideis torosa TaxID=163714 RepID=A0A7R8WS29_9CRUS|nr:unnamed protein product [Cyprideis torosa]CAG0909156.1 unnamed protein product [Cyprideis torosa]